jgi:hypothetical protein
MDERWICTKCKKGLRSLASKKQDIFIDGAKNAEIIL